MVRMLEKDPCRSLPPLERTVREALSGKELGLWDESWQQWTPQRLRTLILEAALWERKEALEQGFRLIAEEGELSVNVSDSVVVDSNGLYARHMETNFELGFEVTVECSAQKKRCV